MTAYVEATCEFCKDTEYIVIESDQTPTDALESAGWYGVMDGDGNWIDACPDCNEREVAA
jgi:hypothetical protein